METTTTELWAQPRQRRSNFDPVIDSMSAGRRAGWGDDWQRSKHTWITAVGRV